MCMCIHTSTYVCTNVDTPTEVTFDVLFYRSLSYSPVISLMISLSVISLTSLQLAWPEPQGSFLSTLHNTAVTGALSATPRVVDCFCLCLFALCLFVFNMGIGNWHFGPPACSANSLTPFTILPSRMKLWRLCFVFNTVNRRSGVLLIELYLLPSKSCFLSRRPTDQNRDYNRRYLGCFAEDTDSDGCWGLMKRKSRFRTVNQVVAKLEFAILKAQKVAKLVRGKRRRGQRRKEGEDKEERWERKKEGRGRKWTGVGQGEEREAWKKSVKRGEKK